MDCEFCKIIKGELPSSKLYENDTTISFMDIADDVLKRGKAAAIYGDTRRRGEGTARH